MTSIPRNIVANVGGRVWIALMSFAFVPFYIRLLGIEAYGLIGFFATMMSAFLVLDMGLSTTVSRELARTDHGPDSLRQARTLLKSLQGVYWIVAGLIGVLIAVFATWITKRWLNLQYIPQSEAIEAVRLMGLVALFRWPVALYTGALMGLRRHDLLNGVTAVGATIQGAGAVLVLWFIPTLRTFFLWQLIFSAAQVMLLAKVTWRQLRLSAHEPQFDIDSIRRILNFAAGVSGITIVSLALTLVDKFVLSKILPLAQFGYYSLASSIAGTINIGASALFGVLLPTLSAMVAQSRTKEVVSLYHKSCQLLAVFLMPVSIGLAFFSRELLTLYVGNASLVNSVHEIVSLLTAGNLLLAVMFPPLAIQLAHGWTKLAFYMNLIAIGVYLPLLFVLVARWGPLGAAMAWCALTSSYVLIMIGIMHRRLLQGEKWRWYAIDFGLPLLISLGVFGAARLLVRPASPPLFALTIMIGGGIVALVATALSLPAMRDLIVLQLRRSLPSR